MSMIDVLKLAREADLSSMTADAHCREDYWTATRAELERFAALVLEEAAKCCNEVQRMHSDHAGFARDCGNEKNQAYFEGAMVGAEDCAEAIRSLKPKGEA